MVILGRFEENGGYPLRTGGTQFGTSRLSPGATNLADPTFRANGDFSQEKWRRGAMRRSIRLS